MSICFHFYSSDSNSDIYSAINQQIALKTIRKFGFTGHAVWNGKEAIDYLMSTTQPDSPNTTPDIILMDVQMPVLDGYRATHILRHHAPFSSVSKSIPIVAMTASAIQGDREKCKKAGMDDYLAKPVKGKTLEKMLVRWVIRKRDPDTFGGSMTSDDDHGSDCVEAANFHPANSSLDPKSEEALISKGLGVIPDGTQLASPTTPKASNDAHLRPSLPTRSSHHINLPGVESEGEREARRNATEEKAMSLRDDKLIVAAGGNTEDAIPQLRGSGGEQLTEANVHRLEEEGIALSAGGPVRAQKLRRGSTNDSLQAVGSLTPAKDSMSESQQRGTPTTLKPDQTSPQRPIIGRRWKDSERTVRQDEWNESAD